VDEAALPTGMNALASLALDALFNGVPTRPAVVK
jgi:hypothetical protein